ncbi:MAG: pimeloyl-ACP methyl ester carboxylesterase [Myxococcota bacterium]|jgi:pimeloyl-ACP methyl ester carboxylesterase
MPNKSSSHSNDPRTIEFAGHDGLRLVADARGAEDAPPVLLLHGGGQTRHAWGGTAALLAEAGFLALTMDQRGHGDSAWCEDGNYRVEDYALDVGAVSSALGRPPALVGASLGGLASLLIEGEISPGTGAAIVLVDVTPQLESNGIQKILGFMAAHPEGFESLEKAADSVAEFLPHRPRPSDTSGLAKNLRLGEDKRYRWHWDPRFLEPGQRLASSVKNPNRLREAAARLEIPALLVRGRMSEIVSEAGARDFLELAPHAEFVDVENAAHMVAGDRNDVFTGAVIEFLGRRLKAAA